MQSFESVHNLKSVCVCACVRASDNLREAIIRGHDHIKPIIQYCSCMGQHYFYHIFL